MHRSDMTLLYWTVLLLFQQVLSQNPDDQCGIYYIMQPPAYLTCDPYNKDTGYGLRLSCSAYGPPNVSFEIDWYVTVNTTETDLVDNVIIGARTRTLVTGGQFVSSKLTINRLSLLKPGKFWCQIVLNNSLNEHLFPSQSLALRDSVNYADYPPCSKNAISDSKTRCATTGLDLSPPDPLNDATIVVPTDPTANEFPMGDAIPLWGYTVIAVGGFAALTILVITACIIYAMVRAKSKRNYSAEAFVRDIPNQETTFQQLRRPLVPPRPARCLRSDRSSLPPHLTVARQPSAADEYTELPRRNDLSLSRLVTVQDSPAASSQMDNPINSDHAQAPYTAYQEGASSHLTTKKEGKEYIIIDPEKRDLEAAEYTDPIAIVKSKPDILIDATEQNRDFQLELNESGAYCNDIQYQSLSPRTKDYTHIYSHPERALTLQQANLSKRVDDHDDSTDVY